jgi:hypothetical protein
MSDQDDVVSRSESSHPSKVELSLHGFEGLFVEEPLHDVRFRDGLLWRGVLLREEPFLSSDVEHDVGSASGEARQGIDRESRTEIDSAATIAEEQALNELVKRAREVAAMHPDGRALARSARLKRIAVQGVIPTLGASSKRLGRTGGTVKCAVEGQVVILTEEAWASRAPSGVSTDQPPQAVLRRVSPSVDKPVISYLADAQEVHRLGDLRYDRDQIVAALMKDTADRLNFLISYQGEDVGFAHIDFVTTSDRRVGWPCMCVSKPDLQGRGLGTRAMEALCLEVKNRGAVPHLLLAYDADVVEKIAKRIGYEFGGMRDDVPYYQPPEPIIIW